MMGQDCKMKGDKSKCERGKKTISHIGKSPLGLIGG